MRIYLIILSVLVISCKKENSLSGNNPYSNVDSKNAFSVKVEGESSIVRKKIINSFVEEKFPTNNLDNNLKPHDEISGYKMSQKEFDDYSEKEKNMSKLVVSYSDHLEVYFLPDKFPLNAAISKLGLQVEPGRMFKWTKHESAYAFPGGKFFLASLNIDDLVKNDQYFYQEVQNINNGFQGMNFKLKPGQLMEVTAQYDLYIQKDKITDVQGQFHYCNFNAYTDPSCGYCQYKMQTAADEFDRLPLPRITEIGLSAKVGDNNFDAVDINPEMINDNKFKFKISANDDRETPVILSLGKSFNNIEKSVQGFSYNRACSNEETNSILSLQKKLQITSQVKVMGRGFENLKNIL
ncbi:MAG: hypothetical protein H7177_15750 [Rhizobacter sp.]|nr:hypothetical protein [Bacteriovorax sp.]